MKPTHRPRPTMSRGSMQAHHAAHQGVNVLVVRVGDLQEHLVQFAGFLANVHHVQYHRVDDVALGERADDVLALTDRVRATRVRAFSYTALPVASLTIERASRMGTPEAISVPRVRQKREMTDFLMIMPKQGYLDLDLVDDVPARLVGCDDLHDDVEAEGERREVVPVVLQPVADGDEGLGQARERHPHVAEHILELRDDDDHDAHEDGAGDGDDGGRVDEGRNDLLL